MRDAPPETVLPRVPGGLRAQGGRQVPDAKRPERKDGSPALRQDGLRVLDARRRQGDSLRPESHYSLAGSQRLQVERPVRRSPVERLARHLHAPVLPWGVPRPWSLACHD